MLQVLVLLLQAMVVATPVTKCDRGKYASGDLCCDLCRPGYHVLAHCDEKHATQCSPCPTSTFMPYHNHKFQCQICADCKDNQVVVKNCTPTSDQQCQCKPETYCDSENCPEGCYPCTRCPGAVRQACNATHDTVCATDPSTEPGNQTSNHVSTNWGAIVGVVCGIVIVIVIVIVICITIHRYCKRRGVQLPQEVVRFFKSKSSEPGRHVHSRESVQPNEDPASGPPARGVETTPLLEEGSALAPGAQPCPGPSDHPGEGVEPTVVSRGSQTTPELALRAVPGAHRPRSRASFSRLTQEYKQKYFLKNVSCDAINKLCNEFRHKLPEGDWKTFMQFFRTEEKDTEVCDHENPGTLTEPHHKIAVCWQKEPGRDVFQLMAVLHNIGLHESLQNIINMLIAENIIGRHAETPN